jgi:hypothetical protein
MTNLIRNSNRTKRVHKEISMDLNIRFTDGYPCTNYTYDPDTNRICKIFVVSS